MSEISGSTRRDFLRTGCLAGASALISSRLIAHATVATDSSDGASPAPTDGEGRILVLIHLAGGNDGLNTVVPYADGEYLAARPGLAISPSTVLKINDEFGWHSALAGIRELYDLGEVAVILGVGYPNSSQAHFRAREIWRIARDGPTHETRSWLARALGGCQSLSSEDIVRITRKIPPSETYPCSHLAGGLELVARLISADAPVRAFSLSQEGYDTHVGQTKVHQRLLEELDVSLSAFVASLKSRDNFGRVLIMIFSEFGRSLVGNSHGGTEHGSAAPMLMLGGALGGGVYGKQPSLTSLSGGQLAHNVDFRRVYATVLEKWLRVPSRDVLGREFPTLGFL